MLSESEIVKLLHAYGKFVEPGPIWSWSKVKWWLTRWAEPDVLDRIFEYAKAEGIIEEKNGSFIVFKLRPEYEVGYNPSEAIRKAFESPTATEPKERGAFLEIERGKLPKVTATRIEPCPPIVAKPVHDNLMTDETWSEIWKRACRDGVLRGERVVKPTSEGLVRDDKVVARWDDMLLPLTLGIRSAYEKVTARQVFSTPEWQGAGWPAKVVRGATAPRLASEALELAIDSMFSKPETAASAKERYLKWASSERGRDARTGRDRYTALASLYRKLQALEIALKEVGAYDIDRDTFYYGFADYGGVLDAATLQAVNANLESGGRRPLSLDQIKAMVEQTDTSAEQFFAWLANLDTQLFGLAMAYETGGDEGAMEYDYDRLAAMPSSSEIEAYISKRGRAKWKDYKGKAWNDIVIEHYIEYGKRVIRDLMISTKGKTPEELDGVQRAFARYKPILRARLTVPGKSEQESEDRFNYSIDEDARSEANKTQLELWKDAAKAFEAAQQKYDALDAVKPTGVVEVARHVTELGGIIEDLKRARDKAQVALNVAQTRSVRYPDRMLTLELTEDVRKDLDTISALLALAEGKRDKLSKIEEGDIQAMQRTIEESAEERVFERNLRMLSQQVEDYKNKMDAQARALAQAEQAIRQQTANIESIRQQAARFAAAARGPRRAERPGEIMVEARPPIEIRRAATPKFCAPCGTFFFPYTRDVQNLFKSLPFFTQDKDWWDVCESCKQEGRSPGGSSWRAMYNLESALKAALDSGATSNAFVQAGVPQSLINAAMEGPPFPAPSDKREGEVTIVPQILYPADVRRYIVDRLRSSEEPLDYERLRYFGDPGEAGYDFLRDYPYEQKIPHIKFDDEFTYLRKSGIMAPQGTGFVLAREPTEEEYDAPLEEAASERDKRMMRLYRYMVSESRKVEQVGEGR